MGWSNCHLRTAHCNFASFGKYLSVREVPQLGNVIETQSAQLSKIHAFSIAPGSRCSLCNRYCILRRFIQRNTKGVRIFLKQFLVVRVLHMEEQTLPSKRVHKHVGLVKAWVCSAGCRTHPSLILTWG